MKSVATCFFKPVALVLLLSFVQWSCTDGTQAAKARSDHASAASGAKAFSPGTKARVSVAGDSTLFCTNYAKLDFAMDAAKDGRAYDARVALSDSAFFSVSEPTTVQVKQTQTTSRWPKAYVTILDGPSAGRAGWVLWSALRDSKTSR